MDKRLHDQLLTDIESLRNLVGDCSSETVVGSVAAKFLKWPQEEIGLSSPHRQLFYLLGLLLTTPEPDQPSEFDENCWTKAQQLLESIFMAYAWMFWPTPEEAERVDVEWYNVRKVAMPAFLHYFNSGLLASSTQVRDRIQTYVVPFDDLVEKYFGISASEMLKITDAIAALIQSDFDQLKILQEKEEVDRHALLDKAEADGWNTDRIRKEASNSDYKQSMEAYFEALQKVFKIQFDDLTNVIDFKSVKIFWEIFAVKRGEVERIDYPTDRNPAMEKPIYLLSSKEGLVPSAHGIYLAVLETLERSLIDNEKRDIFFRRRDQELEKETVRVFHSFCTGNAMIYGSVYETKDLQFEHDVIVTWERTVFVVEAKASPPREPLRDPSKAFVRIRDDFRGDRGIQKAYDQAHRLESRFESEETITLYDDKGEVVLEISKSNTDRIYSICVTRDNYGMIASDLSFLLQKDLTHPYPWAVNILDLESLFDAWTYFGWGLDRFCEYLEGRKIMHGKVFASDELEFAGYLIEHGKFSHLYNKDFDCISLNPSYSEVFDRIFYAKQGGKPVEYKPHPPVTSNLSAEMEKWRNQIQPNPIPSNPKPRKQGRNQKCACGSGKKYKRCCWK